MPQPMKGNIKSIIDDHFHDAANPKPKIKTGFKQLDAEIEGIRYSDSILVAGATGSFKSTLANNMLANSLEQNIPVALYNYEMSSLLSFRRLMCKETGIALSELETDNIAPEVKQLAHNKLQEWADKHVYLIDSGCDTIEELRDDILTKAHEGVRFFVLDYIQLIESQKNLGRTERIERISREIKRLATVTNSIILGVSQFSRQHSKEGKEAELHDMFGSSALEKDAATVIFIKTKKYEKLLDKRTTYVPRYRECALALKKHRHGEAEWEASCIIVPYLYKFINVDYKDNILDYDEANPLDSLPIEHACPHCNTEEFYYEYTKSPCTCIEGHLYAEDCDCSNGLVFYRKVENNFPYEYVGFCSKCARGRALYNGIKRSNMAIPDDSDKISLLPFIDPSIKNELIV